MCKLCNNIDRKPVDSKRFNSNRSKESKEFISIVMNYTDEAPCQQCIKAYTTNNRILRKQNRQCVNIDTYIVDKMLRFYSTHLKQGERRLAWTRVLGKEKERKRKNTYNKTTVQSKSIEDNIRKVINTSTGKISYYAKADVNTVRHSKTFDKLEDARKYIKEVKNGKE